MTRSAARKGGVTLVLAVALLPFGVPRWLDANGSPPASRADADLSRLCIARGGTLTMAPGSGAAVTAPHFCTVRYGDRIYRMDAITTKGFDEDTARYQRQGCEEARRSAHGRRRRAFVYHPRTGVCERRP